MTSRIVATILALGVFGGAAAAPDGSSWDEYVSRSIESIIKQHASSASQSDRLFTADNFPSRVRVIYTGKQRMLPKQRAAFLDKYFHQFQKRPEFRKLFKSEVLIREGEHEYWLSIQKDLQPALNAEVKSGEEVDLFVTWLGAFQLNAKTEWVFTINEFEASRGE